MSKLHGVGAAADGRSGDLDDAFGRVIRGDDVKAGGLETGS
jgi:hypothetical protein